jgi:hypothetical protein
VLPKSKRNKTNMLMRRHWIWYAFKAALFISLGFLLFGWLIMTVWNALIPAIFSGPSIAFSQALGIFILVRLLVWGARPVWKARSGRRDYWRRKLEKRLSAMTPEEREKFKQACARRCNHWHRDVTEEKKEEPVESETVHF